MIKYFLIGCVYYYIETIVWKDDVYSPADHLGEFLTQFKKAIQK